MRSDAAGPRISRYAVTSAAASRHHFVNGYLIRAMMRLGPYAGVPTLRGLCPTMAYRTIAKMKRRLWRAVQLRLGWYLKRLKWVRSGAV